MDETSLIEKSQKICLCTASDILNIQRNFSKYFISVLYGTPASSKRLLEGSTLLIPAYYYKIKAIKLLPSIWHFQASSLLLFYTSFVNIGEQGRTHVVEQCLVNRKAASVHQRSIDTLYNISESLRTRSSINAPHFANCTEILSEV